VPHESVSSVETATLQDSRVVVQAAQKRRSESKMRKKEDEFTLAAYETSQRSEKVAEIESPSKRFAASRQRRGSREGIVPKT